MSLPFTSGKNGGVFSLDADGVFTGPWEVNDLEHVGVNVLSDQDGTLTVQFSIDGTNVSFSQDIPITASQGRFKSFVKLPGRKFRIKYTNGSAPCEANILVAFGNNLFPSSSTSEGEVLTTVAEQENNVFAAFGKTGITATGWAALIDLSDTTNFPHTNTSRIDLSTAYLQVDRDTNATGALRIGVVTRIDETDADVTFVQGISFNKSNDRHINRDRNFSPSQLKCAVVAGATPFLTSQFKATAVTAVNTGVSLDSPLGTSTVTPAVGDMLVYYERTAGEFDIAASCFYHGQE